MEQDEKIDYVLPELITLTRQCITEGEYFITGWCDPTGLIAINCGLPGAIIIPL